MNTVYSACHFHGCQPAPVALNVRYATTALYKHFASFETLPFVLYA